MAAESASAAQAQRQRILQLQHAARAQQLALQRAARAQQLALQRRALEAQRRQLQRRQLQRQRVWQRTAAKRAARQVETELAIEERQERQRVYRDQYLRERRDTARIATEATMAITAELDTLLTAAVSTPLKIGLPGLKRQFMTAPFDAGGLHVPLAPPRRDQFEAERAYRAAVAEYEAAEFDRVRRLSTAKRDHQHHQALAAQRVWADYQAGAREAVEAYAHAVLAGRPWPSAFDVTWRLRHRPESHQLDVDHTLPDPGVVPRVRRYRYLPDRDAIVAERVPEVEVTRRYANVVAQVALRVLVDLYSALDSEVVDAISFNGRSPAGTVLVSVRVTGRTWASIRPGHDDPLTQLRKLRPSVDRCVPPT